MAERNSTAETSASTPPKIIATYDYTDQFGKLLYQVVRLEPKDFRQRRPDGNNGWTWNLDGVQRVPYKLPDILSSPPDMVFVTEGEKDAETLRALGPIATTAAGGTGATWTPEMVRHLAGRDVTVLADNDGAGLVHADKVAAALHPVAKSIRVVWLPDLPLKGDVTDWLEAGHTLEELQSFVAATPLWEPPVTESGDESQSSDWPDPQPLQAELPPVPEFKAEWLPDALRPLAEEISSSMQTPLDYAAAALIVSLSGVVGRRALIRPKYLDRSWTEACNLWGSIVGPPGALKTPVLARIVAPLVKIEAEWSEVRRAEDAVYETARREVEIETNLWEQATKAAIRDGKPRPPRPDSTIWEPLTRRLLVTDATYESLHVIQSQNPAGVLCTRDELSGFLAGLDSEGREREKPYWLQCWAGSGHHTLDRISRGLRIFVKDTCCGLLGNLTPSGAVRLVNAMASGGDDGFVQRFSVTVWPDLPKTWRWIDRPNDPSAADGWERIARAIVRLSPTDPLIMNFDPASQERFIAWYTELQTKLRSETLHPAMASHLSKYAKLVPAIAGNFQLAEMAHRGDLECRAEVEIPYLQRVRRIIHFEHEVPTAPTESTPVTLPNMERAIALAGYLEGHANRLYSCIVTPAVRAAHSLARRIRRGDLKATFSKRDVGQKCWADLTDHEQVDGALAYLCDLNWIRSIEMPKSSKGGRPSEVYEINPKVRSQQ